MVLISNSTYHPINTGLDEKEAQSRIPDEGVQVLKRVPQERWVDFFQANCSIFERFFSEETLRMSKKIGLIIQANPGDATSIAIEQAYQVRPRLSVVHFALQHAQDTELSSREKVIQDLIEMEDREKIGPLECDAAQNMFELKALLKRSSNPFFTDKNPKFLRCFKHLPFKLLDPVFREEFLHSEYSGWFKPLLSQLAFKPEAMELLFPLLTQEDIPELWKTWKHHQSRCVGEWIEGLEAQGLCAFPKSEGPSEYELEQWLSDLESKATSFKTSQNSFETHFDFFIQALSHHPRLNDTIFEGWTMLHVEACQGRFNEVKVLLSAGANPLIENQFGLRPKDLMAQQQQMAKILRKQTLPEKTYQDLMLVLEQAEMRWALPKATHSSGKVHL